FRYSRELKDAKEVAEQASNAKTEFLSTMSHEIRTPLNAVIGLSNFLIEENPREDQKDSLNNLRFSSENLLSLINDILDYNKIDAGKIDFEEKPFNVRRLLDRTIAAYSHIAEEKGIELTHTVEQHVPEYIVGDITRISQILTNLIGNAIKFTRKGYVEVSLDFVARTGDKVAIKFSVQDTGVGIPEKKQQLIFESFTQASSATTREFGGSGLGLSITDKLLGLMGSKLYLKSEVGVGSLFYFTRFFEVSDKAYEKPVANEKKRAPGLHGSKVLIVEDTAVNVLVAKKFLQKWGMIVDSAENGQIAVEKVKKQPYDIILMDLQMPVMDGYEATKLIREIYPDIPVIALTAAAVTEVIEKIEEVGMDAYVTKPFNPMVLHDKLKEFLDANN
ncbi:MAG: response regulator, partial [Cyclobacteriaceae bacterium]